MNGWMDERMDGMDGKIDEGLMNGLMDGIME